MTPRYFKEGPNGGWRQDARAIMIDFRQGYDTHTGRVILRSGKRCPDFTYSSVAIVDNCARGDWQEMSQAQIDKLIGKHDKPRTAVEQVW